MRVFVRYPDTCVLLVYKVTICDLFLYAQFCALGFIAESGPKSVRRAVGSSAATASLKDCTGG